MTAPKRAMISQQQQQQQQQQAQRSSRLHCKSARESLCVTSAGSHAWCSAVCTSPLSSSIVCIQLRSPRTHTHTDVASACFASVCKDHPIHLWDAFTGAVRKQKKRGKAAAFNLSHTSHNLHCSYGVHTSLVTTSTSCRVRFLFRFRATARGCTQVSMAVCAPLTSRVQGPIVLCYPRATCSFLASWDRLQRATTGRCSQWERTRARPQSLLWQTALVFVSFGVTPAALPVYCFRQMIGFL